jgi:hypothetical protein
VQHVGDDAHVRQHVGVRQHHALRVGGGAAGVDDRQQIVGRTAARAVERTPFGRQQPAAVAQQVAERERTRPAVVLHHDDAFELRQSAAHRQQFAGDPVVLDERDPAAAVPQDELAAPSASCPSRAARRRRRCWPAPGRQSSHS